MMRTGKTVLRSALFAAALGVQSHGKGDVFLPGAEIMGVATRELNWGGLPLAVSQSRGIEERFDRFLMMGAQDARVAEAYAAELKHIRALLSPESLEGTQGVRPEVLAEAHRRLFSAAASALDGGASATLAAQIRITWAQREEIYADQARRAGEVVRMARNPGREAESEQRVSRREEQRREEARLLEAIRSGKPGEPRADSAAQALGSRDAEGKAAQAQIQFQGMILDLMIQRRFEHALMGCHFYRVVFKASAQRLDAGWDYLVRALPIKGTSPSVGTLEQLCLESIGKAEADAAEAARLASDRREVAALRLAADAFAVGEHLACLQIMPGDTRGRLRAVRKRGLTLDEVWRERDLDAADKTADELATLAGDFSADAVHAATATARQESRSQFALSIIAGKAGRTDESAALLRQARETWPGNPSLPNPAK